MGKVTKKPQEKHKLSLSPAVSDFVQKLIALPLAELPSLFTSWSERWPYPRGDLMNWVEPLDRFDGILASFITKYGLDRGPQTIPFGSSLLLEGDTGVTEGRLKELEFGPEGDRELIESILVFSRLLVEKCANRAVYNSTDRLNDLLNTTSLSLLHGTLRLTIFLAQRYSERLATLPASAAKFYDYDHGRLQRLASPIGQPQPPSGKRGPPSPVKTKSKDKVPTQARPRRSSTSVNPNDFRSLCKDAGNQQAPGKSPANIERDWQSWVHVKVVWTQSEPKGEATSDVRQSEQQAVQSSPTPAQRRVSAVARTNGSEAVNSMTLDTALENPSETSALQQMEYSASDLAGQTIESVLGQAPDDMPASVKYELLHKLRIAYGLLFSTKSRRELLAIRILAINSIGSVFGDDELPQQLFGPDTASTKASELIQQLVSLIQDPKKGQVPVSLYLQTVSMETMGVLARHKIFAQDINNALGASSAHGLLLRLTQKGLAEIATDNDNTDTIVGDDWREAIFSMPRVVIEATGHHGRSSEAVIASSFITTYIAGLNTTTAKALRVHLRMLDFVKTFFHHFKDGLPVLLAANAFDTVTKLLQILTDSAWQQLRSGHGIPAQFKTRATDYDIPYIHQQIIRSVIDMINDISGHQGAQADRVLRSLVDSQGLLSAFKLIIDQLQAFGAYTWSEVIKALCGFLHNEPTSYTVIAEAGIAKSLLTIVSGNISAETPDAQDQQTISSMPKSRTTGIPASVDAIVNVSQAFGAICLTSAGFDMFKASGALEKFFEIFESPAHVEVMKDANILALLGSTFDELVRHHPNLRSSVMSAIEVMIAKVRHIGRLLSSKPAAGTNLWVETAGSKSSVYGGSEALETEIIPPSRSDLSTRVRDLQAIVLPDGRSLRFDIEDGSASNAAVLDHTSHNLSVIDFARPALGFLMNFFETQSLCTAFMEAGGVEIVLDFITLSSIPVNDQVFGQNGFFHELAAVIHMMAETKPHLILPVLADRTQFACNELKHFIQCQPQNGQCYFSSFVQTPSSQTESPQVQETSSQNSIENSPRVVKALMAVHCLTYVFGEAFNAPIYNSRSSQNSLFGQLNLADILADICRLLGSISAACYREEIALQRAIPDPWLIATRPDNFSTGDDEVDKILSVRDSSAIQEPENESSAEDGKDTTVASEGEVVKQDRDSPGFKNVQTLRYLLIETPATTTEFLSRLGHSIGVRRRMDTFSKQKTSLVAQALATAYLTQLQPYFLRNPGQYSDPAREIEARFAYLVVALANVRGSFYDDTHAPGQGNSRQTFVVDSFRKAGGIRALVQIGTDFFNELKQCKVEHSMFSANTGLKICLEILNDLTNGKSIIESSQSNMLKNSEPSRPFYFVPAQSLLELRMEALPLVRTIWDSEYADQASKDVVQKLVSILKNVMTGDYESEAVQRDDGHPTIAPFTPRKFTIDPQKVNMLKDKGFDEGIAREALYRTNSSHNSSIVNAEEYCKAFAANPRRQRLPIPMNDADVAATTRETPVLSTPMQSSNNVASQLFGGPPSGPIEAALAEVINNVSEDSEMGGVSSAPISDSAEQAAGPSHATSSAMDISSILNDAEESTIEDEKPAAAPVTLKYSVQSIDAKRESAREDLAERCIGILNNHQNLTFELSDLIISAAKKLFDEAEKTFWETTSSLLVSSLLSMQTDEEINEARGKKIAAAAHLTALLIQDNNVFKKTLDVFQESFEGLISFLKLPPSATRKPEDAYPWIGHILLIIERMLQRDAEPAEVKWDPPTNLEAPCPEAVLTSVAVFNTDQKKELFTVLIDLLPRVGKDKAMALSIARVLVVLTRNREIASLLGERRNIQRLFLMVKQLANGIGTRLQSCFMIILRHVVEDQDTLRQIMKSEIRAYFTSRNSSRQVDVNSYMRELYHLVFRSPETFVEVTNKNVKIHTWQQLPANAGLVLKDDPDKPKEESSESDKNEQPADDTDVTSVPAASVEATSEFTSENSKSKPADIKAPVVENPDGVTHFILSELLAYKDVEDKEIVASPPVTATESAQPAESAVEPAEPSTPVMETNLELPTPRTKTEKPSFKPEDHPIFIYRCFLLQCLSELLHSYIRTKVEFINFSRKADPMAATPSRPRSGVLNYVLNGLVASGYVEKDDNSIVCKKKLATSDWAIRVMVALCSKTGEKGLSSPQPRYLQQLQVDDTDDEADLTFIRRFVLEHAIKAFKDATASTETLQVKYSRILCLADMFNRLLSKPTSPDGTAGSHNNSYKVLGQMMFEKNLVSVLTSSLAEIDLSFSGSKRVIKFILRPLQELTTVATQLSLSSPESITSALANTNDDVISSASSVSEVADDREETPDLFRNSALGMLDPNRPQESDSESAEDEEDEEMYDDEDYGDEMEYDDGMPGGQDGDEAISDDEEIDENITAGGPIEGLSGDVPMDIEFVVDDPNMDVDTEDEEDDDDDESEDSDDEDDDEDDGEDFLIEEDNGGELNADDENDSLRDGPENEDEWEDDEGEDEDEQSDEDEDPQIEFDGEDIIVDPRQQDVTQTDLNNLLRVLGEHDEEDDGPMGIPPHAAHNQLVPAAESGEMDEDEEDNEDEEGEEMDENDEMGYDNFDQFMDGGEDVLDNGDQWDWGGSAPPFMRRPRHIRGGGHLSSFLGRRLGPGGEFSQIIGRSGRHAQHVRSGADDGTNPLLQRPSGDLHRPQRTDQPTHQIVFPPGMQGIQGFANFPPLGTTISTTMRPGDDVGGHGAMLDAILYYLHRGEHDFLRGGQPHRININMTAPLSDVRNVLRGPMGSSGHRQHAREEPPRAVHFTPALTSTRWQEETRLLFGTVYTDKLHRVQNLVMSLLVPPSQKEEKERKKREEEAKAERAEQERLKAQAEAEAERQRKEVAEREAAAKAEEEARQRAEAEAAAAAAAAEAEAAGTSNEEAVTEHDETIAEPMEGVQSTDPNVATSAEPAGEDASDTAPRVFTTIRGRQLDITGLAIDVEYLEALPEELREEVIMQQYATRREEAQQQGGEGVASGIDPDFLNALPEDIREEIRQQELHDERRRAREALRRQQVASSGAAAVITTGGDMDNDDFLATLDPALRRAILAEQPAEVLQQLDPRHAAEGRAHARRLFQYAGVPINHNGRDDRNERESAQRDNKRQVVQLLDKAGVATLLRLMFLPQQGSLRSNLWQILRNVCGNRQTRFEVINMLLVILREGSTDISAVERSLASLSLRAKAPAAQRTPLPLKRTLSMQPSGGVSDEVTPLVVIQQCLSALKQLSQHAFHVKTIFLREVDVSGPLKTRKGKAKDAKTKKYPINDLISLLDRKLIMESSSCLQSLAELLALLTSPLPSLLRKDKDKPDDGDKKSETGNVEDVTSAPQQDETTITDASTDQQHHDQTMSEAPTTQETTETVTTDTDADGSRAATTTSDVAIAEQAKNDDETAEDSKSRRTWEPPVISDANLQLIVSIFVAQECNSDTFHATLETLSSLSCIPDANTVFGKELIDHVKNLSHLICADLDDFLPLLREAQSSTDLHGATSSKFSHTGSDQVKLLRVLSALDYLSAPKKDSDGEDSTAGKSILTASYDDLSLGPLWKKLSECLTVIHDKDNAISFAQIILPMIESLMVVCKNTSLKETSVARQAREEGSTDQQVDTTDDLEDLFFNFTTEHRKILNDIIRTSPKLMQGNGSFSLLVKNPKVLDFDNKRAYFSKQIHSRLHQQQRHVQPPLQLNIRRDQVFIDSYKALYYKSADEMKFGKLNIRFSGEEGVDAGGVTREWFQVLARGIFNPDWALWQPVAADRTTFHPNPLSWINGEHLLYFKFIGRIIGKALHEGRVLDCHFSRAVYKGLLGKQPSLRDLESMDLDYYKSLVWILENDITDIITEDFSVIEEQFGEEKVVDLIENGHNIPVTEENKKEYVQKLVEYRLTTSVTEQLENFIRGFHDIIPAELVAIFDEQELELLISGLPEIDVDDWKANTEYHNYSANSPQVTWFWRIVRAMSNEERAKLLQFITGTSKVPLNGFKDLEGMQGTTRFSIHRDPSSNRLPTSHTCFNQLDLPAYDSQEILKTNILKAINLGADYFGFA